MPWREVDQYLHERRVQQRAAIAVWGWGSTEQHGPRMPLDTDTLIAEHFASFVADKRDVLKFPTVPVGMSRHHEAFPGTVSLSQEAAYGLAASVLRSVYRTGIRKLVAIMGHGGNVAPFHAALKGLGNELDGLNVLEPMDALFYTSKGKLGELLTSFGETVSHAGAAECSILYAMLNRMARHPEVEHLQAISITDGMVTLGAHGQGTKGGDPDQFRRMFPYGSKGDQRKADVVKGDRILNLMETEILRQFDEFVTA